MTPRLLSAIPQELRPILADAVGTVSDCPLEDNPYELPVYHQNAPGIHDCRPRIYADCAGCAARRALCGASPAALTAILGGQWICSPDCAEVVRGVTD